MGFHTVKRVLPWQLPPSPKVVLILMAFYQDDATGRCDPSVARLTAESGLGERTVYEALDWLAKNKVVMVERHPGHRSNYCISMENPCGSRTPAVIAPLRLPHSTPAVAAKTPAVAAPDHKDHKEIREKRALSQPKVRILGRCRRRKSELTDGPTGPTYPLADGSDWSITKALLPDLRKVYNGMAFSIELKRIRDLLLANPDLRVTAEAMPSLLAQYLAKPVPLTYIERVREGGGLMICKGDDLTPEWEALPTKLGISEDQVMVYLNRTPPPKFPSDIRAAVRTTSAQTTTEDEPPSPDAISAALELEAQLAKEIA